MKRIAPKCICSCRDIMFAQCWMCFPCEALNFITEGSRDRGPSIPLDHVSSTFEPFPPCFPLRDFSASHLVFSPSLSPVATVTPFTATSAIAAQMLAAFRASSALGGQRAGQYTGPLGNRSRRWRREKETGRRR